MDSLRLSWAHLYMTIINTVAVGAVQSRIKQRVRCARVFQIGFTHMKVIVRTDTYITHGVTSGYNNYYKYCAYNPGTFGGNIRDKLFSVIFSANFFFTITL